MAMRNWMSGVKRLVVVAIALGGFASTAPAASTSYTWTGSSGANWDAAGSWSKTGGDAPAAYPDRAGDTFTTALVGTMNLNLTVTVGQARKTSNTSPGTTIAAGGGTLIMDNTGGTTNPFGTNNASIQGTGNFAFTIAAPIQMLNTDLDIGPTSSNGNVVINGLITNTGNTGDPTAAHSIYLRANNANTAGSTQLTIGSTSIIGSTGANISIYNVGTSNGTLTNTASIAGKLGSKVVSVEQNSALSTLLLSGENSAYAGTTTITQGTVSLGSATALGGNGSLTGTGGALIINGGAINASGSAVALSTVNAQSWNGDFTFVGSQNLNMGTGSVTLGGNRIVTANNNTFTIGGAISGVGFGLTKRGAGTMNLTGNNAYTGTTAVGTVGSITSGGTLQVSGTAGTINASTGTINIAGVGSRLLLDNTAGSLERVSNASGIRVSTGGEFQLTQGNTTTNVTETIGTLTIDSGYDTVTVVSASGRVTLLSAAGFSRQNNGTALVRGSNLNATATTQVGRIQFADTSGLTLVGTNTINNGATGNSTKGLVIVPYLIGDNSSTATGGHFLTYDTTLGLRLLTSSQEAALTTGYTTSAAPDNALAGASVSVTNAAGITINSLLFNSASNSTLISANSNPLTINSGAMASVVNQQNGIEGFSSLNFGNGEAVVTVISNTFTISSPINVTSGGGLTKSGGGTLVLRANNLYTGATIINAGTLRIGDGAVGTLNAASVVTITPQGTLQINRPSGDTFANNIVHHGTLSISTAGTQTLSGNISGNGAINIATANNTLVLSGTNSYAGGSNATAGVLQFNSVASVGGTGRNLAISSGAVGAAGYAIDQAFLDRVATASAGTVGLAANSGNDLDFTGFTSASLGATGAYAYTGTLTPDGTNYRVGGGAGVLTFSNTNAFTGGSNVLNVINGGTVVLTGSNNYGGRTNLFGGSTLRIGLAGALPTGTTLNFGNGTTFGATTVGNLDVQFDQTVAGLLANTNTASANTINIALNRTLTINGAFTLGGYTGTGGPTTVLNISGDGSLVVNGDVRTVNSTDGSALATVDLGGLANFAATSTNFLVGDTSSGITVQPTSYFKLGAGTNIINATNVALGNVKGSGAMTFSGATGTLKMRGLDGLNTTPVTNFNIVNVTTATGANPVSIADFTGHNVDILATNLTIGNRGQAGGGTGQTASAAGTLTFSDGVVETVNLTMAQRSHANTNAGTGNVSGELTVGGSLTASALLKVTGSTFSIGRNTASAGGSAVGTLNVLTNGTVESDASIVDTGGAGATTTTINLNGGTLNLKGNSIGDATNAIDNFILAGGTLANVAQINNGAAITKTTAATLTLAGTNTFTGLTTVQAGTLNVDGTTAGAVTIDAAATLGGTGTIAGAVTINGTLAPGASAGRLTVQNDVTFGSGATFAAEVNGPAAGTGYDQLTIDGDFDVTLGGATLAVSMGAFEVFEGQKIYLIDNSGAGLVSGQFAGLGEGAQIASLDGINGFNWNITYAAAFGNPEGNANDVAIVASAVPEPAGLGTLLMGAAALLRRRRRR